MTDETTLVAQLLLQLREEMTTGFTALTGKIDGQTDRFVPRELYVSERDSLRQEIAADRAADLARAARRQWAVSTLLAVLTVAVGVFAAVHH